MNINPNAWYHQIFKFYDTNPPYNLCPYVRKLILLWTFSIGSLAGLCLLLVLLGAAVIFGIGMATGLFDASAFNTLQITGLQWVYAFFAGVISCASIGGILYGSVALAYKINEKRKAKKELIGYKEPSNIVIKYISAKHNKICPSLTFKEPK